MNGLDALKNEFYKLNIPYTFSRAIWIPCFPDEDNFPPQNYIQVGESPGGKASHYCYLRDINNGAKLKEYTTTEYHRLLSDILNFYYENIETP